jgi:hypothetical protein
MGLGPGLRFRFARGGRILARGEGAAARDFRLGGDPLPLHEVPVGEARIETRDGELSYIVSASGAADGEDEESGAIGRGGLFSRRAYTDDDERDDDAPRRGFALFGRRGDRADDVDGDDDRPARGRRASRRASYDDDDDRPRSRARTRERDDDDGDRGASRSRKRKASRYSDDDW